MPQLYTFRFFLACCFVLLTQLVLGQIVLCTGTAFTTANIITPPNGCQAPYTYQITGSSVAGIANGNAAASYTPTGTGSFSLQVFSGGNPCGTPQLYNVVGFDIDETGACFTYDIGLTDDLGSCTVTYTIDGEVVPSTNEQISNFNFGMGGSHTIVAAITNCASSSNCNLTTTINVPGPTSSLNLFGDQYNSGSNVDQLQNIGDYLGFENTVVYCVDQFAGVTNNFPVTINGVAVAGATSYTVLADGINIYSGSTVPSNLNYTFVGSGFHTIQISVSNGTCISTLVYNVYCSILSSQIGAYIVQNFTPQTFCSGEDVCFLLSADLVNPNDMNYVFAISCGPATFPSDASVFYTDTIVLDPGEVINYCWTSDRSSCGCTNANELVAQLFFQSPCLPMDADQTVDISIGIENEADFTFNPYPCIGVGQTYNWLPDGNLPNNTADCRPNLYWTITNSAGTIVDSLGPGNVTSLNSAFISNSFQYDIAGEYEVCLRNNTQCSLNSAPVCHDICVSDNITGTVNWNGIAPSGSYCASGGTYTVNPTYNITQGLFFCPGYTVQYIWEVDCSGCNSCDNPGTNCATIIGNGTINPTIILNGACNYTLSVEVRLVGPTGVELLCARDNNDSITITTVAPPTITATAATCLVACINMPWSANCAVIGACGGSALTTSYTIGATSYLISNPYTFTTSGNQTVVYTASTTVTGGLCTTTQNYTVVVSPAPTPSITGTNQVCVGSTFSLSASGCSGVGTWTQGPSNTTVPQPTGVTMSGTSINYTYSCNVGGCVGSDTETVTPYPTIGIVINGPATACSNLPPQLTTTLSGTGTPASYVWTENTNTVAGANTASYNDPSFTANTTYGVTVTSTNGCTATASLPVTVQNAPTLNCGNISFCETDVTQGITFSNVLSWPGNSITAATWTVSNGSTTFNVPAGSTSVTVGQLLTFFGNITATSTFTLSYSLTSAATNCVYTDNCSFTIIAQATTTQTVTACAGQTLTLTPVGAGTWSWLTPPPVTTTGASGNTFNFTPTALDTGGPYLLLFNSGCQDTEYSITVGSISVAVNATTNSVICSGGDIAVTGVPSPATNIQSYAWTTSPNIGTSNTAQFNLSNVTQNVTLSVLVTNTLGCTGTATYPVTIDAVPVLQTATLSPYYCETSTATIALNNLLTQNGSPATGVNWTFCDQPITGTSFNIQDVPNYCGPVNADVNDSLEYTFTSAAGCVYSGFYLIQIDDQSITNDTRTICANAQLSIPGIPAATWNTSALPVGGTISTTGGNFTWTPTAANAGGPYSVTYNSGCSQTIYAITVEHFDIDVVTNDPLICPNASASLSVNITNSNVTGYAYEWHQGSLAGALLGSGATQSVSPTVATNYYVIVTTTNCSRNDNVSVSVEGVPTFNNGLSPQYCETIDQTINLAPLVTFPAAQIQSSQWSLCSNTISGSSVTVFNAVNWCGPINADECFDLNYTMTTTNQCTHTHMFSLCIQNETETTTNHNLCEGSTLSLTGLGNWINVSLPAGAPASANGQNGFVWNTTTAQGGGPYTLEYNNGCSATYHQITVHETPVIDITVPDPALCLQQTTAVNSIPFTAQSWEYTYVNPSGTLTLATNAAYTTFDPQALGITNTAAAQICLHAQNTYPVTTPALVCVADDCANVNIHDVPAFPAVPSVLCYQEPFSLTPCAGTFDDFELDFNGTIYGSCPVTVSNLTDQQDYTLTLIYGGSDLCEVATTGTVDIAQPLIANMTVTSDPCDGTADLFIEVTSGENYVFELDADASTIPTNSPILTGNNDVLFNIATLNSDFLFPIEVAMMDACDTIYFNDEYQFIHPPNIVIDYIQQTIICSGEEVQFTINENAANATDFIDEVFWDYGNGTTETLANTSYPDPIIYEALGVTETYNISATASNQCGSYTSNTTVTVYPVDVSVVLPPLDDVCPGQILDISDVQITGTYVDQTITFSPNSNISAIAYPYLWQIPNNAPAGPVVLTYEIEGCSVTSDQSFFNILTNPTVNMNVQANDGICTGEPVFFDITQQNAVNFDWYIDGVQVSSNLIFSYTWDQIGTHDVTVVATSSNGCFDSATDEVVVNGPDISIVGDEFNFCGNKDVELAVSDQALLEIVWTITADGVDTVIYGGVTSINHYFQNTGQDLISYNVHLFARDFDNCVSESDYSVFAKPSPIADFTFLPPDNCFDGTEVDFINTSEGATNYFWVFDDGYVSIQVDVSHGFSGAGEYFIQLQAFNSYNCSDVTEQSIVCGETNLYVPNVFTPNADGTNDTFKPIVYELDKYEIDPETYSFIIKDRWGTTLFETNDYQDVWTGNVLDGVHYAQNDAYVWLLTVVEPKLGLIIIEREGLVTLVR